MFERLSLDEARHVLADFFEIHTDAPHHNANKRAGEILKALDEQEEVALGMLPTVCVAGSVVSYLPDDYEPDHLYLVHKSPDDKKWYTKKVMIKKV